MLKRLFRLAGRSVWIKTSSRDLESVDVTSDEASNRGNDSVMSQFAVAGIR